MSHGEHPAEASWLQRGSTFSLLLGRFNAAHESMVGGDWLGIGHLQLTHQCLEGRWAEVWGVFGRLSPGG